jgi:hypothetical protein
MATLISCFLTLDLLTNTLTVILIQCMLNLNLLTSILTNIDVVSSLSKIWTSDLGIWENNWATIFISTYDQISSNFDF